MTYAPDIRDYQQLEEPKTGPFDCTAYSAALLLDAHTQGRTTTTGRTVRLRTDEPIPDPDSPGLNLPQVDAAIRKIAPAVDLDTRVGYQALTREQVRNRVVDGRYATLQVYRGILVERGFAGNNAFRGGHAITIHTATDPGVPIIGDPLVGWYIRAGWDAVLDAAEACPGSGGRIYTQWTRDLTPDYHAIIRPDPGYQRRAFARFIVRDGQIVDSRTDTTGGFDVDCTPPRYYPNKAGGKGRLLVQLTEGARKGWYVDDRFAKERNP